MVYIQITQQKFGYEFKFNFKYIQNKGVLELKVHVSNVSNVNELYYNKLVISVYRSAFVPNM